MDEKLPVFVASAVSDLLSVLMGVPPMSTVQATLQTAFQGYLGRKKKEAQEILLNEIGDGLRLSSETENDRFFSLLFRYLTAAKHGASRLNLRLLAGLVSGSTKAIHEIRVDELAYYADILSQLSRDEIVLIATLWKHYAKNDQIPGEEEAKKIKAFDEMQAELIPKFFQSKVHMMAVCQSAARTGLLILSSVWGGTRIDVGPLVKKIVLLTSFEAALAKEPIA